MASSSGALGSNQLRQRRNVSSRVRPCAYEQLHKWNRSTSYAQRGVNFSTSQWYDVNFEFNKEK